MIRKHHNGLQISKSVAGGVSAPLRTAILCGVFLFAAGRQTGMAQPWLPALTGAAVCLLGRFGL